MNVLRIRAIGGLIGGLALGAAFAVCLFAGPSIHAVAGGSGDSPTSAQYTSPVVPAMSLNPTAMSLGATATASAPPTTLAEASPTLKATAAPGCVNNGQCP
jgi:hypothetical protein